LRDGKLTADTKIDFSLLGTDDELVLAQKLRGFSDVVIKAADDLNPSLVATHVFEMAKAFNQFYHSSPILKEDISEELKNARLALVEMSAKTIQQGLHLLNIETMEEM
jgi:arginyl-tRNA synthetase